MQLFQKFFLNLIYSQAHSFKVDLKKQKRTLLQYILKNPPIATLFVLSINVGL